MSYQTTGTIKAIGQVQEFEGGFKKRELLIETKEQYPQTLKFEILKDRVTITDNHTEGQEVSVFFNIRGSEFKGRVYTNLVAWKLDAEPVSSEVIDDEGSRF